LYPVREGGQVSPRPRVSRWSSCVGRVPRREGGAENEEADSGSRLPAINVPCPSTREALTRGPASQCAKSRVGAISGHAEANRASGSRIDHFGPNTSFSYFLSFSFYGFFSFLFLEFKFEFNFNCELILILNVQIEHSIMEGV
jgi:hypothetical protein